MNRKTASAIGVLTSGSDAPGMNTSLRAVVRPALGHNIAVYATSEGYHRMVDGSALIHPLDWDDTRGIMQLGGTVIGTARSQAFRTRDGRLQAVKNLIELGGNSLHWPSSKG